MKYYKVTDILVRYNEDNKRFAWQKWNGKRWTPIALKREHVISWTENGIPLYNWTLKIWNPGNGYIQVLITDMDKYKTNAEHHELVKTFYVKP